MLQIPQELYSLLFKYENESPLEQDIYNYITH